MSHIVLICITGCEECCRYVYCIIGHESVRVLVLCALRSNMDSVSASLIIKFVVLNGWLCYKPDGRGFDSQLNPWIFFSLPNPCSQNMALGLNQPLTEMSTRNHPEGE
jgi:hypothetical protein